MRKFKSVLALLLALAMLLSCVGVAAAAKERPNVNVGKQNGSSAKDKGALSAEFKMNNSYRYADDEIVRAIVVLETAPEADIDGNAEKRAAHRATLLREHEQVRKAMGTISYEMGYEFTALLNGFSCDVAYGDLEAIAEIDGVSAVHIANSYDRPVLETPQNEISGLMMGNYLSRQSGYTGKGIVVAVLDTGLRTTHEAFQEYASMPITETLTEEDLAVAVAPGKYLSAKVPFSYDYADKDNDVTDKDGHGTHVSGTAVGYAETEDGAIIMSGAAPAAQLLSMKIFYDDKNGTRSDVYFYALEDAYRLGADVVNMSIGAQNGFTYDSSLESEVFGNIYKRLEAAGIVLCVSAGNEYSMNYYSSVGFTGPEYMDYGTVGTPSTYEGSVSIASVENAMYPDYVIEVGGEQISFIDSCADKEHGWIQNFGGKSVEFVVLKNAEGTDLLLGQNGEGNAEGGNLENDYEGLDVTGKIVVMSRGTLSFEEKVEYAAKAGAVGAIICNTDETRISMSIETFEIPAVSAMFDSRALFLAAEPGDTLFVPEGKSYVENPEGWQMSSFSNWGTSPMLTIDPTLTGVGGRVYSSVPTGDSDYEIYSGTSMAAPNATGTFACVLQALVEEGFSVNEDGDWVALDKAGRADRAKDLLESTGIILADADGYIYSVRKQGSGLANSANAIDTYFNGAFISNPIQELGDDKEKTGVYTMELELVNEGFSDITYDNFGTYVLYDYLAQDQKTGTIYNTLTSDYLYFDDEGYATVSYMVDGEEVTAITLHEGEKKTVTVTITLSDEAKAVLDANYENGTFIEGYVSFSQAVVADNGEEVRIPTRDVNADTYETHATFLAFYGDWTQAPAMETINSFDFLQAAYLLHNYDLGEGKTYADMGVTEYALLNALAGDWYTDINWAYGINDKGEAVNYLGYNFLDVDLGEFNTEFMPEHISFTTPESDGTWYYTPGMYIIPNLLRNARHIVMTVTDAETGEVYMYDDTEFIPKDAYDYEEEMWQNYSVFSWDGTKEDRETYVPSGTVATVTFDIQLPYGEAEDIWQENVWSFDVTVDSTAPVIESVVYDEETQTVTVTASDEQYLAGIYLCSMDYSTIYTRETFSSDEQGKSFTATFDVSNLGTEAVIVTAMDYATNENEQICYFFEDGLDATVTFVTPAGSETVECVTSDEIKLPEAEAYEGYSFEGWTTARYTESDGSDVEALRMAGSYLMVSEQEYVFYALYSKGQEVTYDKIHYELDAPVDFEGYWAFVGFPFISGDYLTDEPIAMGSKAESIQVSAISDAEVFEGRFEFATNYPGVLYYLQYFANYDAYAIINGATGQCLLDVNGVPTFMSSLYLEGLWTLESDDNGNIYCYNYNTKNDILLFNEDTLKFEIMDDTVANEYDKYPSQWYSLFLYRAFDTDFVIDYYTTEICLCDFNGHVFGEWTETKAAGCTDEGEEARTCEVCGLVETRGIPAHGHEIGGWVVITPATCTTKGVEGRFCAYCDLVLTRELDVLTECAMEKFEDVIASEWYHDYVDFVLNAGIMNGVSETAFDPNGTVTRAMAVTVLYRAAGCPEVAEAATFEDVAADAWYADAVAWAQAEGIALGTSETTFEPEALVTREQIATFLWRANGSPVVEAELTFEDAAEISGYAVEAMKWAASEGIFEGDGDNMVRPFDTAIRVELAAIITRVVRN